MVLNESSLNSTIESLGNTATGVFADETAKFKLITINKKYFSKTYLKLRCLLASKIRIAADTDTLIESIFPFMGIIIF